MMKKLLLAAALLCATSVHADGVNVLMHHNDSSHTGANLAETQLTTANVNPGQFGKLWDYEVDSEVYAQPLIVQNITIPGLGTHNVLIVATMNNTVYAFDADDNTGPNVAPLWQTNFNNPAAGLVPPSAADVYGSKSPNIDPLTPVGIVSTPVVDPATDTLYVVSRTVQNGVYGYQLHALDLTTGADRANSPAAITASVPGTASDASNGVLTFNAQQQLERNALGLARNQVVIAWGSQGDITPYHGWVMTYDEITLQQTGVFNTSPTGSQAAIWQSGDGPTVDAEGNVYYAVGNGTFDGVANFGESIIKFDVSNGIALQSFFAPSDYLSYNGTDSDLGSSAPLLIPGTSLLLNGSKNGYVYLLNTASLGGEVLNNTQIPQSFRPAMTGIYGSPVYYPYSSAGPLIYIWPDNDLLTAYQFNGTTLSTAPAMTSSSVVPTGKLGGVMSISANGSQSGTGIVWANIALPSGQQNGSLSGALRAFDASNVGGGELYDTQSSTRDSLGLNSRFTPPTVANGKVYMATFSNKLRVYGLLSSQAAAPSGKLYGSVSTSTGTINLTAAGSSDWTQWPGYVHKASGGSQISDIESLYPPLAVQTYTNDQRAFTWTDGTPTATGSLTSGVEVSGFAGGFRINAPADTNTRTLTVFVGGSDSVGHLRAYLSDGSAEDFVDVFPGPTQYPYLTNPGAYYRTYTLTYAAGQSGQLLYVEWTQGSPGGTVTFAGAVLAMGSVAFTLPPPPTGIAASQGTTGSAVAVSWGADNGATGYTVYRSTVAGTQGAILATTASTRYSDTTAVAGTTYYYSIVANNADGSSTVSAQVSGYVPVTPPGTGALSGMSLGTLTTANLTTVGTTDWAHWPEFTEKATGGGQIRNYTVVGSGSVNTYSDATLRLTWSDGNKAATGSATTGSYILGVGKGFSISVPADTLARQVTVYLGGYASTGKLVAHLSDGSAADYTDASHTSSNSIYQANYTLTYHAASAGQTLTLTWTMLSGGSAGNVVIDGAALAGGPTVPTVPATPTGLSATQGTSSTSVTVNWTAVSTATGYTVYRSTSSGTQGTALGITTTNGYTDATAVAGNTYYYSVAATNAAGASASSAQVSGYVAAPAAGGGALSGVTIGTLTTANLTTAGTSDWAHWPEFTGKATGGGQISNYALVGTGTVSSYSNAPLKLTWTDGNKSASGSATTGSYVTGTGTGFRITVPADTTPREITVYLGGWSSNGKLTAHLSDGSAADFTDASFSSANGTYQANYTLTYHAASAGQTLTLTWTMISGASAGNVVIDGAALAGGAAAPVAPATPGGLTATQGTSGTAVTVSWTGVSGATGYTLYRSTAAGTQGALLATTASPGYVDGTATPGSTFYYSVAATNAVGASAISPQVSGYVAVTNAGGGALGGAALGTLKSASLTTVGTADWAHWPEFTEKVTGGSRISNYAVLGKGAVSSYSNAPLTLTWTDGNRAATGSATTGSYISGIGNGFEITVPADTVTRQLTVYLGGYNSAGKLVAHLSDGSAADFTDSSLSSANGIYQANYTLTYHAASAGQTLTLSWTQVSGPGNVVIDGAALAGGVPITPTGALSGATLGNLTTANLTAIGTTDWAHWPEYTGKATGGSRISNYIVVGKGTVSAYSNAPLTLSWTDGNKTATGSATSGSYISGSGNGFEVKVPADTTSRQITVYVGGYASTGKLTAHLSDGSAADFTNSSMSSANSIYQANYTLTYHAASAGQTLTVTWTLVSGSGNVVIDGAALH